MINITDLLDDIIANQRVYDFKEIAQELDPEEYKAIDREMEKWEKVLMLANRTALYRYEEAHVSELRLIQKAAYIAGIIDGQALANLRDTIGKKQKGGF